MQVIGGGMMHPETRMEYSDVEAMRRAGTIRNKTESSASPKKYFSSMKRFATINKSSPYDPV